MIVPPTPQPFWQQLVLETWHNALTIVGALITATWAIRSNRQHERNEGKIDRTEGKIDALHEQLNGNLDRRIDERIRMARGD